MRIKQTVLFLFLFAHLTAMADEAIDSLNDLRWEYRLIIGNIGDNDDVSKFQKQWQSKQGELVDRKLVLILIAPDGLQTMGLKQSIETDDGIRDEIIQKLKGKQVALIGLDGGVKSRYGLKDFYFASVFGQIDQMPMRVNELRSRSK
ncbi:DUF4174 domain-containing protein [Rubellicoccus peritrichatus]|uniref:DUF4174 domain-containing protein n=1 Tax=Rubellicoccus peritrichatus TaxID=3080537 RepID=A0AAQ3L8J6_9BACT|nr:DUF4174 domain-containing protein [Puniceicoccus sp. CR14]WOO41639.1 DUF4174 domain-containing protein [Puniceicoccus sp. CR14]